MELRTHLSAHQAITARQIQKFHLFARLERSDPEKALVCWQIVHHATEVDTAHSMALLNQKAFVIKHFIALTSPWLLLHCSSTLVGQSETNAKLVAIAWLALSIHGPVSQVNTSLTQDRVIIPLAFLVQAESIAMVERTPQEQTLMKLQMVRPLRTLQRKLQWPTLRILFHPRNHRVTATKDTIALNQE